jgi:glutathione S-transferase
MTSPLALLVRRTIAANPERLFRAWTTASEFVRWWGPRGVICESADIDLCIGGAYRIANRLPDGGLVWISGTFEEIEPPHRLAFSWRVEPGAEEVSRVVVTFQAVGEGTEVVVLHERIARQEVRQDHEQGWTGCLEGLAKYAG